jgi:hypothetical protein
MKLSHLAVRAFLAVCFGVACGAIVGIVLALAA